jgi:hypothetical protein
MASGYLTLDSRLIISKDHVTKQVLKSNGDFRRAQGTEFLVLLLFIWITLEKITYDHEYLRITQLILIFYCLSPHLHRIYRLLFVDYWRSAIPLAKIRRISTKNLDNGIETKVTIHLANGRQKQYIFRNAEQQADAFMAELRTLCPALAIQDLP